MYPETPPHKLHELVGAKTERDVLKVYTKSFTFLWENFRNLFLPVMKEAVRRKAEIDVNLHPEDEAYIRKLGNLDPQAREKAVQKLITQYYHSKNENTGAIPKHSEGFITRYELLSICSDAEVFRHVKFYRNYEAEVTATDKSGLWLGSD